MKNEKQMHNMKHTNITHKLALAISESTLYVGMAWKKK